MNRKFVVPIASVLIGLLGAGLVWFILKMKIQKIEDTGSFINYVVAAQDLEAGTKITMDVVSQRPIPSKYEQSNGVLVDEFNLIEDGTLKTAVKAGDVFTPTMVEKDERLQIATKIPVGSRAITIPVDDESSISSMLKPGDLIDLLLTVQRAERFETIPLISGVKIIATGDAVSASQRVDPQTGQLSSYANITLEVSLEDAKRITMATQSGKITAILRNPLDASRDFQVVHPAPIRIAAPKKPYVEKNYAVIQKPFNSISVIYGNTGHE